MDELQRIARVTIFGSRETNASFDAAKDIPSLAGKVILITGAAGDLGRQTATDLARYGRPARIYIADLPRDDDAKKTLLEGVAREAQLDGTTTGTPSTTTEIRFLDLDLTSFQSIRKCATEFAAQEERLDMLILNAGIIRVAPGLTTDGYEIHFGLNYLGHALLFKLLAPTLVKTAESHADSDVRVVVVSSEGHAMAPSGGVQFDHVKTECTGMSYSQRYGQSKIALICLAREIGLRYPQLKAAAVHPGRILTGMAESLRKESLLTRLTLPLAPLVCVSVPVGVKNHLWAATSPDVVSGKYYEPVGVPDKETLVVKDTLLSSRLWDWTEEELKGVQMLE